MTDAPDFGEPWTISEVTRDIVDRTGQYPYGIHGWQQRETRARIVACVNACRGIPTADLDNVQDERNALRLNHVTEEHDEARATQSNLTAMIAEIAAHLRTLGDVFDPAQYLLHPAGKAPVVSAVKALTIAHQVMRSQMDAAAPTKPRPVCPDCGDPLEVYSYNPNMCWCAGGKCHRMDSYPVEWFDWTEVTP